MDDGLVTRGSVQRFRAILDDPNGDALTTAWRAEACNAAQVCAGGVTGLDPTFQFTVPVAVEGQPTVKIAIHLDVADSHRAVARPPQALELPVSNGLPAITFDRHGRELGGSFPPGVPIVVVAGASDPDRDAVTLTWELFPARDSNPAVRRWQRLLPDPEPSLPPAPRYDVLQHHQLVPDVPGEWSVRVTASDGTDVSVSTETLVVVPDQAPCLGATDPAPAAGALILDHPRRFAVLVVDDDLDPYPWPAAGDEFLGPTRFRWYLRAPGATTFTQVAAAVAAFELDPAQYAPGDRLDLRVELGDRTGRAVDCGPDAATCSALQNPCLQRQTWTVEVR